MLMTIQQCFSMYEVKETILDFSQGNVKVLQFYFVLI